MNPPPKPKARTAPSVEKVIATARSKNSWRRWNSFSLLVTHHRKILFLDPDTIEDPSGETASDLISPAND
jgi:hypothetical protein